MNKQANVILSDASMLEQIRHTGVIHHNFTYPFYFTYEDGLCYVSEQPPVVKCKGKHVIIPAPNYGCYLPKEDFTERGVFYFKVNKGSVIYDNV